MSLFLFEDEPWALFLPLPDPSPSLLWSGGKPGHGGQCTRSPTPTLHLLPGSTPSFAGRGRAGDRPVGPEGAQEHPPALSIWEGTGHGLWEANKQPLVLSLGQM